MSELNITLGQEYDEDLSGVDGDGLGEGEVAFEGEEWCWEDGEVCLEFLLQPVCESVKNPRQGAEKLASSDASTPGSGNRTNAEHGGCHGRRLVGDAGVRLPWKR